MNAWCRLTVVIGLAVMSPPAVLADGVDTPAFECQSCTARHKALQKLQEARTGNKADASTNASSGTTTDDNALIALPPEPQSKDALVTE